MKSKAKRSEARSCSMHQFVRRAVPCMSLLLVTTLPGVALSIDHATAVDLAALDSKVDDLAVDHDNLADDHNLIVFDFLVPLLNELRNNFIEDKLMTCTPLPSLFLPLAANGNLERVRNVVADRITDVADAGINTGSATFHLNNGDARLTAGLFKLALRSYCNAFAQLTGGIPF